ncbi:MAG: hypothetical protein KAG66_21260, partial [Methylococcales bacterium]|nr:hypothetical protein [Methylococcales bacterium]
DIMIHIAEDDVYFMGDNVFNGRMGRMDDGSYVGLNTTLDSALEEDAAYYVPGHGPTGDKEVVLTYQALIAGIYAYAQEYYEEGLSDFEMKPLIAEKLKRWHSWPDFNDTIGRLVSFAALEAEAHAFD